jgi:hypothetical protein
LAGKGPVDLSGYCTPCLGGTTKSWYHVRLFKIYTVAETYLIIGPNAILAFRFPVKLEKAMQTLEEKILLQVTYS